jgi:hypothetical protein
MSSETITKKMAVAHLHKGHVEAWLWPPMDEISNRSSMTQLEQIRAISASNGKSNLAPKLQLGAELGIDNDQED